MSDCEIPWYYQNVFGWKVGGDIGLDFEEGETSTARDTTVSFLCNSSEEGK